MKHLTLLTSALICTLMLAIMPASAQNEVTLSESQIHLGRVPLGSKKEVSLNITNNTPSPMVLLAVTADCGCTKPKWPREPIPSKATATITLIFTAEAKGQFYKGVTVRHSASKTTQRVILRGEVI